MLASLVHSKYDPLFKCEKYFTDFSVWTRKTFHFDESRHLSLSYVAAVQW